MPKKGQNNNQNAAPKPKRNRKRKAKTGITPNTGKTFAPVAIGTRQTVRKPRTRTTKDGHYCVQHSELIDSVAGTDAFSNASYAINPGVPVVFPWLSQIAPNYESYRFKKLHFRYVPTIGTDAPGSIYMAPEFNNNDSPPVDESQIASYDGCVTGNIWQTGIIYRCSQSNLNKRKSYYVRNGSLPANADIDLYDTGYHNVATVDCGGAVKAGKLWVDYDVEFMTPQLNATGVGRALSAKFTGIDNGVTVPVKVGIAPLTASVAAGVLTFTASQPYQCLVNTVVSGNTLTATTVTGSATVTSIYNTQSSSGASLNTASLVNFLRGQTYSLDFNGTTVTAYITRFAQYDVIVNA